MRFADVSTSLARGGAWMLGMRLVLRLVGIVNVVILARILSPEDFGVVAMATLVVGLLQLLSDVNVDLLLLRNDEMNEKHMNAAWTLQVVAGLFISIFCVLVAPLLAAYYSEPRVITALYIVALQPAIAGFENVGVVRFRRNFEFRSEFAYWVIRYTLRFAFGLGLALALKSYLALAIAVPMTGAVTVAVSYAMSSFRPKFEFAGLWRLWRSARWLVTMNVGQYVTGRGDEFVVGGFAGTANTGTYYVVSDIAAMVNRELVGAIGRAVYPTVSRLKNDASETGLAFERIFSFHVISCCAIGVGLALVAPSLVLLILGEAWAQGIPVFRRIALASIFEGLILASIPFLITTGHERLVGLFQVGHGLTLLAVLFAARGAGEMILIAELRCLVAVLALGFILSRLNAKGLCNWQKLPGMIWRPALSAVLMAGAVTLVASFLQQDGHIADLAIEIATGTAAFVLSLFSLWHLSGRPNSSEADIWTAAQRFLKQDPRAGETDNR